jgi:hypothetical protein
MSNEVGGFMTQSSRSCQESWKTRSNLSEPGTGTGTGRKGEDFSAVSGIIRSR